MSAGQRETERLRAMLDVLLPVGRIYVDSFAPGELVTLTERLALQRVEAILADPDGWEPVA